MEKPGPGIRTCRAEARQAPVGVASLWRERRCPNHDDRDNLNGESGIVAGTVSDKVGFTYLTLQMTLTRFLRFLHEMVPACRSVALFESS